MDELLKEYVDKFGENFPVFLCLGMEDDEIISIIKKCLKDGEPYKADYDPNNIYWILTFKNNNHRATGDLLALFTENFG